MVKKKKKKKQKYGAVNCVAHDIRLDGGGKNRKRQSEFPAALQTDERK